MAHTIVFWILAVLSVVGALSVVVLRDIFRAALALVFTFFVIAGVYVSLNADFLAAVQVLVYVGAIAILLIFALMLTREPHRASTTGMLRFPALIVALILTGVMVYVVISTNWTISTAKPVEDTVSVIANSLFRGDGFILPLEIGALLLLAAVIGAAVMAREK